MNERTILIIGSKGQLGLSFRSIEFLYPDYKFFYADRRDFDLRDKNSINDFFKKKEFETIINCAAYTLVDEAQSKPDLADQINHLAVKQIAEIAKKNKSKFIHISTDYVFNGRSKIPYVETDKTEPLNVYGKSKLDGDEAIQKILANNLIIIRTSWIYSEYGNNFVRTILKLGKELDNLDIINDQIGTPTYAKDLARTIMTIIQSKQFNKKIFRSEIFHFSNEGLCSWYDFAKKIFELNDVKCNLSPIKTEAYPAPANRPRYGVLNKSKIKKIFGLTISNWEDSIKECLSFLEKT